MPSSCLNMFLNYVSSKILLEITRVAWDTRVTRITRITIIDE